MKARKQANITWGKKKLLCFPELVWGQVDGESVCSFLAGLLFMRREGCSFLLCFMIVTFHTFHCGCSDRPESSSISPAAVCTAGATPGQLRTRRVAGGTVETA